MLEGYIDFFMDPSLADCYWKLKEEFDKLLQKKVSIIRTFYMHLPAIYCNSFLSFILQILSRMCGHVYFNVMLLFCTS